MFCFSALIKCHLAHVGRLFCSGVHVRQVVVVEVVVVNVCWRGGSDNGHECCSESL